MWKCKKCGEQIEDNFEACWQCGTEKAGSPPSDQQVFEEQERELETEVQGDQLRYPALRLIARIYRRLAWLVVVLGVIGVIFGFVSLGTVVLGVLLILGSLIGGAIGCVTLLAVSEALMVFIDIEENTRLSISRINRKIKK